MKDIKDIRKEKNMTQQQVAEKANISLRQLVRIENRQCFPNLETRILIYKALGVDRDEIIEYIVNNYIDNNN